MINGAHAILYSDDADATRATLAKVLGTRTVDAGGGWLIFALPPAEFAVYPAEQGDRTQFCPLCDDVTATVTAFQAEGIEVARPISDQGWGLLTTITLPVGVELGLYQPRDPTAAQPTLARRTHQARSHRSPRALATGCRLASPAPASPSDTALAAQQRPAGVGSLSLPFSCLSLPGLSLPSLSWRPSPPFRALPSRLSDRSADSAGCSPEDPLPASRCPEPAVRDAGGWLPGGLAASAAPLPGAATAVLVPASSTAKPRATPMRAPSSALTMTRSWPRHRSDRATGPPR
jgi:hypothetical protein